MTTEIVVSNSQTTLKDIYAALKLLVNIVARALPTASDPTSGKIRAILTTDSSINTVSTVTSVTSVASLANITNVAGFDTHAQLYPVDRANWSLNVRNRIT